MAKVISKMSVQITGSAKGLVNAYGKAGAATTKFGAVVKRVNKSMGRLQASAMSAARGMGAFLGVAGTFGALGFVIKTASDMEETMNKFNVVWGDGSARIKEWSDTLGKQLGRSKVQVAGFMAAAGDLFKPLGFALPEAEKFSKQITQLSFDLASFNVGIEDSDAFRDLTVALTGSGEVMKKYGVILTEAAVKQELLNMKIDPKVATNQQKVFARLNIIMAGTKDAQGDAMRSMDSFKNSAKRLKAQVSDLAAALGKLLLPSFTGMVKGLQTAVKWLEVNGRALAKATVQVTAFAAGWLAWTVLIPKLYNAFILIVEGIRGITMAFITLQGVTGVGLVKVIGGLAVAAGVAYAAGKAFDSMVDGMTAAQAASEKTAKAVDKVGESVEKVAKKAKEVKVEMGLTGGDVGAARAGTTAGFSAVHTGRKHLLRMLQVMRDAQRERKKQTAVLNEISANTAEKITINQAQI